MPIDPSIPLSGVAVDPSKGVNLGLLMQRYQMGNIDIQQAAAETQRQNQLRALLGSMQPQGQSGQYAPNQLQQMMALDPKFGIGLGQQQQEALRQQELMRHQGIQDQLTLANLAAQNRESTPEEIEAKTEVMIHATRDYLDYAKAHPNASQEEKTAVGQQALTKYRDQLGTSGKLRPQIFDTFPANYDPVRAEAGILKHAPEMAKTMFPLSEEQRAEKKLDEPESPAGKIRRDQKRGFISGAEADKLIAKLDAPPAYIVREQQEKSEFGGKVGDLLGALAEKGVNLPAGFRSKAQMSSTLQSLLDRNPGKSVDEIADKVAAGKIEFGAETKETQVAAGQAGKIAVAQNEIKQFAPLVLSASEQVPRGSFVPINKLVQMSEANISDPNLKRLKVYINTLDNAYDQLAARGGTDKEKRAENRSNLMAADSPATLKVAIDAYLKEAEAAERAASQAMKPRSQRSSESQYIETRTTPDGRRLGKKADGTIEVIQ